VQGKSTPNKRRGLRKLECDCGAAVYATWSQVERFGVPSCNCGGTFEPEDVELAYAIGLDTPLVAEYTARVQRSIKAQQPHEARGRKLSDRYSAIAVEFENDRRERALANRLNALRPVVAEPMPF
jgi:hypothetical protein